MQVCTAVTDVPVFLSEKVIQKDEAMAEVQMVVEGVYAAKAAHKLAEKYNVEMPIVEQVNAVLFDDKKAVRGCKKSLCFVIKRLSWQTAIGGNILRVIAGTARSLPLKTVDGMDTRPTTDRIKETLFNMLQTDVYASRFLDLFAGSGAIGIEALSRGAKAAVFVEHSKQCVECIKDNTQIFTKTFR